MVTGETEDMKSFIYVKIRFIGVLFLLILFNSITVFAAVMKNISDPYLTRTIIITSTRICRDN